jgi:hypothetical protein
MVYERETRGTYSNHCEVLNHIFRRAASDGFRHLIIPVILSV